MKWSSERWQNEVWTNWAHLFLCKSNIRNFIGTLNFCKLRVSTKFLHHINRNEKMGSTMHNKHFSFTFTNVKYKYKKPGLRCWLEWAPHSASTISVLSMTYSTPVSLVRTGQGVSFVSFSFSFWVPLSQLKHHPETTLKHWIWPEASNSFFLASSYASSSFLPFRSCSNFHISFCTSYFWVLQVQYPIIHSFPLLFSIFCLLGQVDTLLMQLLDFSHQLLHLCGEGSDDDLCNWST